ncbi:MAG: hypothetical protein GC181_13525 [Bacteroidetes bacterium]|nr:hypothetical protein [Bacteroidota bacterium]
MIKRILMVLFLATTFGTVLAQHKEINPNIDSEWRFIRSQEMNLLSGSFYSFEFPAEKGFDYIFNLTHNQDKVYAAISVFDMQDRLVKKVVLNESNSSCDLAFDVDASATYRVVVGITDPKGSKGTAITSQFSLIRRIKI